MFAEEDILFDEELFIKNNLSFLIESDDEFSEDSDNQSVHFISYEEEKSIYGKSTIPSSVKETWSSSSSGSIPSPKEIPSTIFNIHVNANLLYKPWNDPDFGQSFQSEFSFMMDFPNTKTSTPIKKCNQINHPNIGIDVEGNEKSTNLKKTLNMTMPLNKTANMPPLTELNLLSQIDEKKTPIVSELNVKTLSNTLPPINKEDQNVSCEICLRESSPKSLTLADFIKKPVVDSKSDAGPQLSANTNDKKQTKESGNNDKENNFCKFCYKNGELTEVFTSHITKKSDGTVLCPILRNYVCELCGQTGDNAHTRKYCLLNADRFQRKPLYRRLSNGVLTSSHNHK